MKRDSSYLEQRNIVTGNPFCELPYEILEIICGVDKPGSPLLMFRAFLTLSLVDRSSYRLFMENSYTTIQCLMVRAFLAFPVWSLQGRMDFMVDLSRLVICDTRYMTAVDEFFDAHPKSETIFHDFAFTHMKENMHTSEHEGLGLKLFHIVFWRDRLPRPVQRLLVYYGASLIKYGKTKRIQIRRATPYTCLSNTYVYPQDRILSDTEAGSGDTINHRYSVSLTDGATQKIDVRLLKPLTMPLSYAPNETLYEVINAVNTYKPDVFYAVNGQLSPTLDLDTLLKRVRCSEVFRTVLLECRRLLRTKKGGSAK